MSACVRVCMLVTVSLSLSRSVSAVRSCACLYFQCVCVYVCVYVCLQYMCVCMYIDLHIYTHTHAFREHYVADELQSNVQILTCSSLPADKTKHGDKDAVGFVGKRLYVCMYVCMHVCM